MSRKTSRTSLLLTICLTWLFVGDAAAGDKETFAAARQQAQALEKKTDYAGAARQYERALSVASRLFGDDSVETAAVMAKLGHVYVRLQRRAEAQPLLERSLKIREAKLEADDADLAQNLHDLAFVYDDLDRYAEAEPLLKRCIKIREASLGPNSLELGKSLNNLAGIYYVLKQFDKAEPLYQRAISVREAHFGHDHLETVQELQSLANVYLAARRYDRAESLFQRCLTIRERALGPDDPTVVDRPFARAPGARAADRLHGKTSAGRRLEKRPFAETARLEHPRILFSRTFCQQRRPAGEPLVALRTAAGGLQQTGGRVAR